MLGAYGGSQGTFAGKNNSSLTKAQYTFSKAGLYIADSTGRDTYITSNNGGFACSPVASSPGGAGKFLPKIPYFTREKGVVMHSKPVHYRTDGTGRDAYVHANNGGLTAYGSGGNQFRDSFRNQLRGSSEINNT